MAGHLLVIPLRMDFADTRAARQPVQPIAPEDAVNGRVRHANCMIARHVPHDAFGPEVVLAPKMENLLLDLDRCLVRRSFGMGLALASASSPLRS